LTGFHPKPVFLRCFLFSKMPPNLDIDEIKPFSPFFWLYYLIIMCSVKCQAQILALLSIFPPFFWLYLTQKYSPKCRFKRNQAFVSLKYAKCAFLHWSMLQ
jgi:hypothetical protein